MRHVEYGRLEMKNETTVVFLHGAGTGPWVWQRVMDSMPAPGIALEVPGRHEGATPDSCAEAIVDELERRSIGRVAIVMHSLAGVLAPGLSARLGDRVTAYIYVAAVIPPPGKSFVDVLGFPNRVVLRLLFRFNRQGLTPSPAMIRKELCNDLSEADAAQVVANYAAEWPGLYMNPVGSIIPGGQATYIKLLDDRSVNTDLQSRMIGNLSDPLVRELRSGHLVMLSRPKDLGALIMEAIEST